MFGMPQLSYQTNMGRILKLSYKMRIQLPRSLRKDFNKVTKNWFVKHMYYIFKQVPPLYHFLNKYFTPILSNFNLCMNTFVHRASNDSKENHPDDSSSHISYDE